MFEFLKSDGGEEEEESYDGERVDGLGDMNVEIAEIIQEPAPWIGQIPKPFVTEDGTRMYFFSPEKEVELEVVNDE